MTNIINLYAIYNYICTEIKTTENEKICYKT